ncbi:MAG: hypothetical protein H0W56_00155 [Acidothermales bacterium]|nr:hypothetical protein [Acidothermales bacterium]
MPSRLMSVSLLSVLAVVLIAPPTLAATGDVRVFTATLTSQNDTGASGFAEFVLDADSLAVRIEAEGLLPDEAHLQGLRGFADSNRESVCPTGAADSNGDGVITGAEAESAAGPGLLPLLPRTDEASSPRADEDGVLRYARVFDLAEETDEFVNRFSRQVAEGLDRFVVVQAGVDLNGDGRLRGDRESFGLASCGELGAAPQGGVDVGGGGTAGVERVDVLALGGALVTAALALAWAVVRRRAVNSP